MTSVGGDDAEAPDGCREGLRERKKRATRRQIHRSALALVAQRGLDGVTTDEIAAAAGVSSRTFFNYFPTKDAAVVGADPDLPDRLGRSLQARPADEALLDAVRVALLQVFDTLDHDDLHEQRREVFGRYPEIAMKSVGATIRLEAALTDAIAARCGRDEADPYPRLVAAATLAISRAAYVHAQRAPDRPITQTVDAAFALLADGLR